MGEIMIFPKDLFFCQKIIKNFIYVQKGLHYFRSWGRSTQAIAWESYEYTYPPAPAKPSFDRMQSFISLIKLNKY